MRITSRLLTEYDKKFKIGKSLGVDFHKGEQGYPYIFISLAKKVYMLIK